MAREETRKENHALRSITAVMMLFIALAHYHSQLEICGVLVNDVVYNVGRFVIPVFVLISGYFCYSKDGHSEGRLKQKALHILILIVIYKVFYLVFTGVYCAAGIVSLDYLITEFLIVSPEFLVDCFGGTVALRSTQPIWFIYALFLIYGFWFLLYRYKIDFKWSWLIAIPILIVSLLFGEFLPMFHIYWIGDVEVSHVAGNLYPFIILPFFVIGYYMHKHREWIDARFSNGMIWALIFGGTALMIGEAYLVPESKIIYVGSLIVALSVFLGTFRVPEDRGRIPVLEYMGKYMSMWMYVFFAAADFAIRYAFQCFANDYVICEMVGPLVALALDIAMAFAMHKILTALGGRKKQSAAAATA